MKQNNYPQFISNLPCGEDYTEGKSQERLAVAIDDGVACWIICATLIHLECFALQNYKNI